MGSTAIAASMFIVVTEGHSPVVFGCYEDSLIRSPRSDKQGAGQDK